MVVDREFKNYKHFNHSCQKSYDVAYNEALKLVNKIIGISEEKFVLYIEYTDDNGITKNASVFVSDSYIDIANKIASFDYLENTDVNVYSVKGREYASIKHKIYNSNCFDSYAGCTVSTWDLRFVSRRMWDVGTVVHW